ncbi:AaceriAFL072CAp [[Ashbya] aceris (nom. inval.)]|nr:AaceriAFL072CAp [[Ashbya] aceris (nom. inval.)]
MVDELNTSGSSQIDVLADAESTLVHSRTQSHEQKGTRSDLVAERDWETLEKINYVAPAKHLNVKGRIKKSSRRKKTKRRRRRRSKLHHEQRRDGQDSLFHGLVLGSFIGAALTEFVLAKFK